MKRAANVVIAAVALSAAVACSDPAAENRPIPEALVGLWFSDNEDYEGRFFEIRRTSIVFGVGDGKVEYYNHRGIESELVDGFNFHTLYYSRRPGGLKLQFAFYQRGREIRPKNQPTVRWFRRTP